MSRRTPASIGPQALLAQLDLVQARAEAQLVDQQTRSADDPPVPSLRTFEEYVTERAQDQANWHRMKSAEHRRQARTLRIWQLVATGIGVILSAVAGFVPSWRLSTWTAAATTIAAAVGAHLAATQHQRIAATYATTADQLERLIAGIDPDTATPEQQAQFVADVERILLAQNEGWIDLISTGPTAVRGKRSVIDAAVSRICRWKPHQRLLQLGAIWALANDLAVDGDQVQRRRLIERFV